MATSTKAQPIAFTSGQKRQTTVVLRFHPGNLRSVIDQGVIRNLIDHLIAVDCSQTPLHDRQGVSGNHRHGEAEQGCSRVSQRGDFAMQQVGQLLKMFLNFPSSAVGLTAQLRRDRVRKVGDQNDLGLAVAGRLVQRRRFVAGERRRRSQPRARREESRRSSQRPTNRNGLIGSNGMVDECQRTRKNASARRIRNTNVRTQKAIPDSRFARLRPDDRKRWLAFSQE